MSERDTYLILEMVTELVDGYYNGETEDGIAAIRKFWDEARPAYPHLAVKIVSGNGGRLFDHQCLRLEEISRHRVDISMASEDNPPGHHFHPAVYEMQKNRRRSDDD